MIGQLFLDRYETTHFLGQGSMGAVYLARDQRQGRYVVIKVMHDQVAEDPKFRELFVREMQFMARFKHPHAVDFVDASLDEPPCIVMEYIPGATLEQVLEQHRRLPLGRVARLVPQMCKALHAAHSAGIVHRDLKPANFMLTEPDRPSEFLKVMDLGLAALHIKPYISMEKLKGSEDNIAIGTPAYIAPEQLRGDEMDHRGDIYSLGCVLYELLAGRLPFEYEDTLELVTAHINEKPPSLRTFGVENVPPAVEAIIMLCLAKFPNERPQTGYELAVRFADAMGEDVSTFDPAEFAPVAYHPESGDDINLADYPEGSDGTKIVQFMEAWMPERVAALKLRGYIQDHGGVVVDSEPGLIRVHLGMKPAPPPESAVQKVLRWIGGKPKTVPTLSDVEAVAIELHLTKKDTVAASRLEVMVVFRALSGPLPRDPRWHRRCQQLAKELRSYLIAHSS